MTMHRLKRSDTSKQSELDVRRSDFLREINSNVSDARQKYVSPLVGQEMVYMRKEAEAKRYLSTDTPPPVANGEYPFLTAKSLSEGITLGEAAQVIMEEAFNWDNRLATLEQLRETSIKTLKGVSTFEDAEALMRNFKEDLSEL